MITAEQMQQWRALADADAEFVVIAPANLRALLAEVERLRERNAQIAANLQGALDGALSTDD